ncbi:hypothetical protein ACU4HD_14175 [Cupriavidus basilensis]
MLGINDLVGDGVDAQVAKDWITLRMAKRQPLTLTAWDGVKAEAKKAGMTPSEAVSHSVVMGWAGFRAKWIENERAEQTKKGAAWWLSQETKLAKAIAVGVGPAHPGESEAAWEARICAAIDNGGKPPAAACPPQAVTVRDPGAADEGKAAVSAQNRAAVLAAAGIRRCPAGDGDQSARMSA